MSQDSAIRSDVTNASTTETFSVNSTLPISFAFAWFVTRFSEDFLAVSDFQAVQFSIFTFHKFVTAGIMVAIFVKKRGAGSGGPDFIYRPGQAVAISYTFHNSLLVFALLCLFGNWAGCRSPVHHAFVFLDTSSK